ncbi:MAG: DnaA/Hda family protein, partial [Nitrospirota bacterium]
MALEEIWNNSLSKIEEKVGKTIVELWFRPIKLFQIKEQQVTIDIPNRFFKDWIEDNYPDIIAKSIEGNLGYPVSVRYRIAEKIDPAVKKMGMELESRRQRLAGKGIYLNPKYTFENFVVGPSNQFAQAAARAVAEAPGNVYNPLFVYGGVGLGKTHLINAVGNAAIDKRPSLIVLYVSSEQFTNEVVAA